MREQVLRQARLAVRNQLGTGYNVQDQLNPAAGEQVRFGPFCLSPGERLLTREGEPVDIGGRSFDLLVALVEQPGRVLSKRDLLKRVWADVVVEDGSLRFHMAGLRKLLGEGKNGSRYIATQVGVGYAFVAPVERLNAAGSGASGAAPQEAAALQSVGAASMPARLPHIIGRDRDVRLLLGRIVEEPVFTIVGPAGVGKTTLAIDIAYRLADRYEQRVSFVDFSMLEDPLLVPQMIAGAMGIAVQTDDPLAAILGHTRGRETLLLLDNCEHVVEAVASIVERIIEAAPGVRFLATSREALRIRGEHVHRLEALAYPEHPDGLTLEQLLAFPAVQLFCERARAGDSALEVDERSARLIAGMCHRLDGMAFPIELAAVRAATHGLTATAQLLQQRFSLGWSGRRTAVPRQQTLQSMLDWSYGLLTEVQQIVLERLAVFVGPFSIDAALEVATDDDLGADEVSAALDELTAKSLTAPDRSRGAATYRLLEMTRAYAREKLLARGEEQHVAAARRHAAFFLSELDSAALQDEDALHDVRAVRLQLGNIRSALEWSFGPNGDLRIAVRLAAASARVFLNLSSLVECRTWCARGIAELSAASEGTPVELELQAALGISLMFTRGNTQAAGDALSRALKVAAALEDDWSQLRILGCLHIFHERIGEYSIALSYADRAVTIAESIRHPEAIGVAYSLSGISHHLAGDQNRAKRDLEQSLANIPRFQRSRTIHYGFDHRNRSAIALARTLFLTGHADEAIRMADRTAREAARLDHPVTQCIALIWSVAVFLWTGEFEKAEQALGAFSDCAQINALRPYIAASDGFRAELAIHQGRAGDALEALEESLSRLRAARYELLTIPFSTSLALGMILDGRLREANELVDATIARCNSSGEMLGVAELFRIKARILYELGTPSDLPEALLLQSIEVSADQGALAWQLRAATDRARFLAARDRATEAHAALAGVRERFARGDQSADVRSADALLQSLGASIPGATCGARREA